MNESGKIAQYRKKPRTVDAVQWQGDNLNEVQSLAGVMSNMDGDVSTERFLPPGALDVDGERIWNNNNAHVWLEAGFRWSAVQIGQWVLRDSSGLSIHGDSKFSNFFELADNANNQDA